MPERGGLLREPFFSAQDMLTTVASHRRQNIFRTPEERNASAFCAHFQTEQSGSQTLPIHGSKGNKAVEVMRLHFHAMPTCPEPNPLLSSNG